MIAWGWGAAEGWERWEEWAGITNRYETFSWGDKNVLQLSVVIDAQLCEYTTNH